MNDQGPQNEEELREWLPELAKFLTGQLPPKSGFVVLIFRNDIDLNYISNSRRADVVRAMREFITMTEARWGEHIKESDEDSELAHLRQRVEFLESKQKRIFDTGFGYGRTLPFGVNESWKLYLESIGDL